MSDNLRTGFDLLQEDMAGHQRLTGQEVTTQANAADAAQVMTRLERDGTLAQASAMQSDAPVSRESEHWQLRAFSDDETPKQNARKLTDEERALITRMRDLLNYPEPGLFGMRSWRERALAVHAIMLSHHHDKAERYMRALRDLCDNSSRAFGDWRACKMEARKVIVL